jgi:hypothetical protein
LLVAVRVENDFQYPHHSRTRARKKKLGKPQFIARAMCKSWRDAWGFRFVSFGFRLHSHIPSWFSGSRLPVFGLLPWSFQKLSHADRFCLCLFFLKFSSLLEVFAVEALIWCSLLKHFSKMSPKTPVKRTE